MFKVLSQRFGPDFKIEGWSKPWSKSLFENFKWYIVVDSVWAHSMPVAMFLPFTVFSFTIRKGLICRCKEFTYYAHPHKHFFCIFATIYFSRRLRIVSLMWSAGWNSSTEYWAQWNPDWNQTMSPLPITYIFISWCVTDMVALFNRTIAITVKPLFKADKCPLPITFHMVHDKAGNLPWPWHFAAESK